MKAKSVRKSIKVHLRDTFLAGILLMVPLVLTYVILKSLFLWLDSFAQPTVRQLWGITFPGLGIFLSVLFLYGVGLVSTNLFVRTAVHQGEKLVLRIPLVKVIYQSFKEFLHLFLGPEGVGFRGRVVFVEFPKKGFRSLAFQTNRFVGKDGKEQKVVLIPTVPNPTNGFLAVFAAEEVIDTDWTLQEASQFIFSAGILSRP